MWPAPNILDIVYNHQLNGRPNGNNTSFFNDPAVETKIIDAQREADPKVRLEKYGALQKWFDDQAVAVGVYNFTYNVAVAKNLKGLWQDQGNGLLNFYDAYFVKE